MDMHDDSAPAWMTCDDILTRIKDELILEAIDLLHQEMKSGRIDISGYVSLLPDKSDEIQKDMYIIGNLIEKEHEILEQYGPYLSGNEETDPDKLRRIEALKKFVMSVGAISLLMRYGKIVEGWAADTGSVSHMDNVSGIMLETVKSSDERREVLEYIMTSSKFLKSGALDGSEIKVMQDILEHACKAMQQDQS